MITMVFLAGCVSQPALHTTSAASQRALNFVPTSGMAKVYVFRPHRLIGYLLPYKLTFDRENFGVLSDVSFLATTVAPGEHEIQAEFPEVKTATNQFVVEAGKSYFFQVSAASSGVKLEGVAETDGQAQLFKLKPMGWTAATATLPSQWEDFKQSVEQGGSLDTVDENGLTALFWAARRGETNATAFLLAHGADVNHTSKLGETPLMWAASGAGEDWALAKNSIDSAMACSAFPTKDNLSLVTTLVQAGADINARTRKGYTAMAVAALWNNGDIVAWLLERDSARDIPEKWCEANGRLKQAIGDYFLAQDNLSEARASFEQAERAYHAAVAAVKAQVATGQLIQTLIGASQLALAGAAQQQAQVQTTRQMAQIAALSRASREGGGVRAYSAYFNKYREYYKPTSSIFYVSVPDPKLDATSFQNARIEYFKELEKLMGKTVECISNSTTPAELHARITALHEPTR